MKIKKWLTMAAAIMTASCMLFSFAACGETADVDPDDEINSGAQGGGTQSGSGSQSGGESQSGGGVQKPDKDPEAPESQGGGLNKPGTNINPGYQSGGGSSSSGGDEHKRYEKDDVDNPGVDLENGIKLRIKLIEKHVEKEDGEYETVYEETNEYYVSDGYDCKDETVTIPVEYDGKKVTSIGKYAFEDNLSVKKVIIPAGIVDIQMSAFSYCLNLEEVEIQGNTLTTIEGSVFSHDESLTKVNVPDSVTKIGTFMFAHCKALETVTLPNTLSDIGDGMFYECRGLKTFVLPTAMTKVPGDMFGNCIYLEEVTLHEGLEEIGFEAFYGCKTFKKITFPRSLKVLKEKAFMACSNLVEVHYAGTYDEWEANVEKGPMWSNEDTITPREYKLFCDGDIKD